MNISATTASLAAVGANTRPVQATARTMRLWPSLTAAWTRRLDQRIEDDLRWLDHAGVMADFRSTSRA
jgi:hypothetical protein